MRKMRFTAEKLEPTLELAKFFSEMHCQQKPRWNPEISQRLEWQRMNKSPLRFQRLNVLVAGVDVICGFILGFY